MAAVLAAIAGLLISACSQTAAPVPNLIERAKGQTPAAPPLSGFLGSDYSLLQPGAPAAGQEAMLAYTNLNVNFRGRAREDAEYPGDHG